MESTKMYKEEIEIQDRVSKDYESIRYKKSYSIAYQNSWFEEMISLMEKKGKINFSPRHRADVLATCANIKKAKRF